jgi:hypothetical protein
MGPGLYQGVKGINGIYESYKTQENKLAHGQNEDTHQLE